MSMRSVRYSVASCVAGLLALTGCGPDDKGSGFVSGATATVTAAQSATPVPTATATPSPTVTATPFEIAGQENLFGSTAQDSGALFIEPVPLIPVYFSACLGGTGVNCAGGTVVYSGGDPGFEEAPPDEAMPPLYALPDGVTVRLQVVAIDPALSLIFENGTLNAAGQSLKLGTTPGIHADLQWQLAVPGDAPFGTPHPVTLKLTTTTAGFSDSAEFTETVQASTGSAPSEPAVE